MDVGAPEGKAVGKIARTRGANATLLLLSPEARVLGEMGTKIRAVRKGVDRKKVLPQQAGRWAPSAVPLGLLSFQGLESGPRSSLSRILQLDPVSLFAHSPEQIERNPHRIRPRTASPALTQCAVFGLCVDFQFTLQEESM